MSELTTIDSERIYWAVEQVERKVGDIDELHLDENEFYLKSEADKVIAGLEDRLRHYPMMVALLESDKKKIAELEDKLQAADKQIENLINSASSIMLAQDRVNDDKCAELRHQEYKRCLAMTELCNSEMVRETFACFRPRHSKEVWREEHKYWAKWRKRWLELAEKFKEAK